MAKPKVDIHEIIRHVINNMDNNVLVTGVELLPDGNIKVTSCYTAWLMEECIILNGLFKVIELVPNEYFIVEALTNVTTFNVIGELPIQRPFYFHGTVRATNAELTEITLGPEKFPMIYCHEVFRQVWHTDPANPNERTSNLRLFFLASADFDNWITENHYEKVIIPMSNMLHAFFDYVDHKNGFGRPDDFTTVNWPNFGKFVQDNGNIKKLFNDELSGKELEIGLVIKDELTCEGFCGNC